MWKLIRPYQAIDAGGGGGGGDAAAAAAAVAAEAAAALAAGGDWKAALPEDVRSWDEFKDVDTAAAGFERIAHMRTKFGTGLFAPGENASAKDWEDFYGKLSEKTAGKVMPRPNADDKEGTTALYKQLGRPDEASGYEFAEGTTPEDAAAFGTLAHGLNLTVAQLKGLDEGMVAMLATQKEAQGTERTAGLDKLKGEWGAAWTERTAIAEKVRAKFLDFIPADGLNAVTMSALHALGAALGGEGAELLGHKGGTPEPTILEAKDQIEELSGRIAEIQRSRDGKRRDEMNALVLKRRALYKKAYPGGEVQLGGKQGVAKAT